MKVKRKIVNNEIYLVMYWDSYDNKIGVDGVFSSKVKAIEYLWEAEAEGWEIDEYDEFLIDIDERYPYRDGESGNWIEKYEIDELIKTKKDKIKEILEEKIEELRELASERYIGKDGISMVDYLDEREYKKYEYYNNLLEGIKNGDRNR